MFTILHYYITLSSTYSKGLLIFIPLYFQLSSSQDERAKIIHAQLLNPIPEISRAITEAEDVGKGTFLKTILLVSNQTILPFHYQALNIYTFFSVLN